MNRAGVLTVGMIMIFILGACGSTTAASNPSPSSTAVPSQTPAAVPSATSTPVATPVHTPTPTPAPATGTVLMLRQVSNLGQILVDAKGITLYIFERDTGTTSTCVGSCAQNWPPLITRGMPRAMNGVMVSLVGTTSRGGGVTQVTYHGHPLYYFVGDGGAGIATGQGINAFGGQWEVVSGAGTGVGK